MKGAADGFLVSASARGGQDGAVKGTGSARATRDHPARGGTIEAGCYKKRRPRSTWPEMATGAERLTALPAAELDVGDAQRGAAAPAVRFEGPVGGGEVMRQQRGVLARVGRRAALCSERATRDVQAGARLGELGAVGDRLRQRVLEDVQSRSAAAASRRMNSARSSAASAASTISASMAPAPASGAEHVAQHRRREARGRSRPPPAAPACRVPTDGRGARRAAPGRWPGSTARRSGVRRSSSAAAAARVPSGSLGRARRRRSAIARSLRRRRGCRRCARGSAAADRRSTDRSPIRRRSSVVHVARTSAASGSSR